MELTWLGHACFCLEAEGYRIVTDSYTEVEGYPELRMAAHQVVCSHGHHDHGAVGQVELLPPRPCPFAIREVESFHDEAGGALRGGNTIRVFTAGGISVAHLGGLGHMLTEAQLAGIGPVDGVLVPVGGSIPWMPPGPRGSVRPWDAALSCPCTITTRRTACRRWLGRSRFWPCGRKRRYTAWRVRPLKRGRRRRA